MEDSRGDIDDVDHVQLRLAQRRLLDSTSQREVTLLTSVVADNDQKILFRFRDNPVAVG